MAMSLNMSDLIINERALGDSIAIGSISTISSLVLALFAMVVFAMLKRFKGFTPCVQFAVIGVATLVVACVGSLDLMMIGVMSCVLSVGMSSHSTLATLITLESKGDAVGTATSLYTGATFVGEFLCGYVPPILAGIIFGTASPTNNMLVVGVALLILAVVSIPIGKGAYKLAFPDEN